jgi:hypothetical protein
MFYAILPVMVLVIGLLLWALASNPVVKEAGRLMFATGLFVSVWMFSHATVRLP